MKENQKDVINLPTLLQFPKIYFAFQFCFDKAEPVSYSVAPHYWYSSQCPFDQNWEQVGSEVSQSRILALQHK